MIPKFQDYLLPFLKLMNDGKIHILSQVVQDLAASMNLTDEDLSETMEKSGKSRHNDRCSWAKTYLSKAGLIQFPKRANFMITEAGRNLLNTKPDKITVSFLKETYPSFAAFCTTRKSGNSVATALQSNDDETTPLERMELAYNELINSTIDDLLRTVKEQTPLFFENLVVQLLVKMGYGGDFEDAAHVTQLSKDGGIDGIIKEDALGLDKIYIQAKRWNDKKVNAPDIQQFLGALLNVGAQKGIYITTSTFTDSARRAAQTGSMKIVLIDGEQLARYMVNYNLGVITTRSFDVKRVDVGFFQEEN